MRSLELARSALIEIRAHKARSAMTCLSLAIGVAAMLFTFSQTAGVMKRYDDELLLVGPGRINIEMRPGYVSKGLSPGLTLADARAIRRAFPGFYMVDPRAKRYGTPMRFEGFKSKSVVVEGVSEQWALRDWVYTLRGRWLSREDVERAARVCVLVEQGGWVRKPFWAKYFQDQALTAYIKRHDPLGRRVRLGEHLFTVVGVIKEPPLDRDPRWFRDGDSGDGTALVPISTFQHSLNPPYQKDPDQIAKISIDTGDSATVAGAMRRVEALLLQRHRGEDDVVAKDFRQVMDGALKQIRRFILSILVIGIVAILASGIGIMNVTLATIFSRVREIGVRRALGATRGDIIWQFVSEAMVLGLAGGAAGTLIGVAGIALLAPRADRMAPITPLYVAYALAIALATGFLFALYPAYQAARFDPVEALRYE
ncbi:MAG: ABC transporter permease [Elusimicrobia bacterium]|nr:ABC transporter permease [Elusimicrobiota bacterium]MDE2425381.1 ABC transporter permease [Elusimicrobiota bacterium]